MIAALAAVAGLGMTYCAIRSAGLSMVAAYQRPVGDSPPELGGVNVSFLSKSGALIHGWWAYGRGARQGTMVLMHGIHSSRLGMLDRAIHLHNDGYNVLLFDFQAHGESIGRYTTIGYLESFDAAAAVDFAARQAPGTPIGVIGVSMGGAAALLTPLPVSALVLEAVYPDIGSAMRNRFKADLRWPLSKIAPSILVSLFQLVISPIIGVEPAQLQPIKDIAAVHAPILVLAGDADRYTPPNETRDLYDHAHSPKCIAFFSGADHVDLESYDRELYWKIVSPFLAAGLATPKVTPTCLVRDHEKAAM